MLHVTIEKVPRIGLCVLRFSILDPSTAVDRYAIYFSVAIPLTIRRSLEFYQKGMGSTIMYAA